MKIYEEPDFEVAEYVHKYGCYFECSERRKRVQERAVLNELCNILVRVRNEGNLVGKSEFRFPFD